MPNKLSITIIGAMCIFTASAVNAHSPEMHKNNNAERPKCEAMNKMDHSTMDMNDPIIQAMMLQCTGSDNHIGEHQGMEKKNISSGHDDIHKTNDHDEMKKSQ